jgi:hypothetical protein
VRNVQVAPRDVEVGDDIVAGNGVIFTVTARTLSINGYGVFRNAANDVFVVVATGVVTIQIP